MPVSVFSRYADLAQIRAPGPDGRQSVVSLALRLPVESEEFSDSILHTVVRGETLDTLSQRYYGREDLGWRIMDANALRPEEDDQTLRIFQLEPGDQLTIPPVRVATRFPRR